MIKVIQFKPNNNLICYGVHKIDDLTNVILPTPKVKGDDKCHTTRFVTQPFLA